MSRSGLTVIFRTYSDIEANVVQSLLDSQGVETVRTSGPPSSIFPFSVSPMGETHISVRDEDASSALPVEHRCGSIEMLPCRSKITSSNCRPGPDLKITELDGRVGVAARAMRFAQHGIDRPAIGTVDEQTDCVHLLPGGSEPAQRCR